MLTEFQQALTVEPPEKCPYFTLPDVRYFLDDADFRRRRSRSDTVVLLWGTLAKMSDESQAAFLLALLKHSKFEPDWQAVAKEWNLAGPKHIKSRFKSIVESHKYILENDSTITGGEIPQPSPGPSKITPPNQSTTSNTTSNAAAHLSTTKPAKTRKRKRDNADNGAKEESSKKRSKKKATRKDPQEKKRGRKKGEQITDDKEVDDDGEGGAKKKTTKSSTKQKSKKAKEKDQVSVAADVEDDEASVVEEEA